jgi:hypothetical protein
MRVERVASSPARFGPGLSPEFTRARLRDFLSLATLRFFPMPSEVFTEWTPGSTCGTVCAFTVH